MKFLFAIFMFFVFITNSSGQNRNAVWCFGDSAGINFYNTSNPTPITSGMNSKGTCSTISDSLGNLLFYCAALDIELYWNGIPKGSVYNRNHEQMMNGDSLNCEGWYHEMVIVPNPNNNNQYYIFHIGVTGQYGLYYTIVDMTQDSGRGAVVSKNNQLLSDLAQDCLQTVKHGNGKDWWLLFYSPYNSDSFFVYSITSAGVALDHIDSVGIQSTSNGGDLRFNSTGTQFAYCSLEGALALYDFDRCTGRITQKKIMHTESSTYHPYFFDVCFSPNDSLLYVSSSPYYTTFDTTDIFVYQLKLWLNNPYASRDIIWNVPYPHFPGAVRLGPDKKIYIAAHSSGYPFDSLDYTTENMNLSVIHEPDQIGAACDLQTYSFYLGGQRNYWGLPNNPDYDLPPLAGSICDTIYSGISELEQFKTLEVFPNPCINRLSIAGLDNYEYITIRIFDTEGRLVIQTEATKNQEIDVRKLSPGLYLIVTDDGYRTGKTMFVKIKE